MPVAGAELLLKSWRLRSDWRELEVDVSTDAQSEASAHFAPAGSQAWDQETIARDSKHLTAHLETVAGSSPIQLAWQYAIELMQLRPGNKALDAGCGAGSFLPAISDRIGPSGELVGLDHASAFLDEARQRYADAYSKTPLDLIEADISAMPFSDAYFDSAHCERVLIHVIDPQQAISELRRVVKPGGWVVAVEPDLAGWRIDHEDAESARFIAAGFAASIRHPAMGLQLSRRMAKAGLVERQIRVITEIETTVEEDAFIYFERAADKAIEQGWLTATRARTALQALAQQIASGHFASYSSMFVCAGRVPDESELGDK
jgi:ubiquinone/menaquinone biosynthesis C-methylase UbiE